MIFLTISRVTEILCSFRLVLEGKTGKDIPESSRLEFLEKSSANNFDLSDTEDNSFGPLNRGGIFWTFKSKFQIIHVATYISFLLTPITFSFKWSIIFLSFSTIFLFLFFAFISSSVFTLLSTRHTLQRRYNS